MTVLVDLIDKIANVINSLIRHILLKIKFQVTCFYVFGSAFYGLSIGLIGFEI